MSNEKTSEGADWRHRLNQLDALPDTDGAWREPAWEKLYTRLQEKEQLPRRRMGWYWAAAACLVIGMAISLLPGKIVKPGHPGQTSHPGYTASSDQSDGPAVPGQRLPSAGSLAAGQTSPPVVGSQEQASVVYPSDSSKKESAAAIHPTTPAGPDPLRQGPDPLRQGPDPLRQGPDQLRLRPVPTPGDLQRTFVTAAGAAAPSIVSAGTKQPANFATSPAQPSIPGATTQQRGVSATTSEQPAALAANTKRPSVFTDSTVLASTASPLVPTAKRKLRVVHINELGMPVPEDSPSSHMAGNFFLRIRLFNNDAPSNQLMGSNNEINLNPTFKISFKN